MYFRRAFLLMAAVTAFTTSAHASVVTFSALTSPTDHYFGPTYQEGGLTFASSYDTSNTLLTWGKSNSANADPGGATLLETGANKDIVVTRTGGGTFDLISFDLADGFNSGSSGKIKLTYVDKTGTHSTKLTLDKLKGLQSYSLNLHDITSFSLTEASPFYQIDNVNFTVAAVPELSTWGMMGIGFAGLGYLAYRRKNPGSFATA